MRLFRSESGNKEGNLMIFLHGGGVGNWMWDLQLPAFKDYHCIAFDLPEHGNSSNISPFSIHRAAESVKEVIAELRNDKKVIVIGFSLGAQVLIELIANAPDLIDYAIINSASVTPVRGIRPLIKPSIHLSFPLVKVKSFARLQARKLYIHEKQFNQYFEESKRMKKESLIRVLEESMTYTLPEGYANATCRILVTTGALEVGVIKESYQLLLKENKYAEGVVFPKIGHGAPLAIPEAFNQTIRNWLIEQKEASTS